MKIAALARALVATVALSGCSGCGPTAPGAGQRTGADGAEPEPAGADRAGAQRQGPPVETRKPNGADQAPAFPGQTRAPYRTEGVAFDVKTVAKGLERPWGLAFLPDGAMLVTEKPGRMRIVAADGTLSAPLAGVPEVDAAGQGGLLDVVLGPTFAADGVLFFSFAEPRDGGNGTAVARARLVREGAPRLEDVKVLWRMTPTFDSSLHFGSRLVFSRDGTLLVTTGERSDLEGRRQARSLDSAFGKVVRIRPDGSVPEDNPFASREGALRELFSIGHRNMQGAALHPRTGELWIVDHGPRGGDELKVVRPGTDHGWPTISYGAEYSGGRVGEGATQKEGLEQPLYFWDPSIAPSGMAFYDADLFPAWKGSLFVGALVGMHLARLTLDGEKIVGEERLLADRSRVRTVQVGPDGALYLLTDAPKGELLAIVPKGG